VLSGAATSTVSSWTRVAIPLAIRSLSRSQSRCDRPDDGPDPTCADAPRWHEADGSCLTSNP
jgi:hypothetical protein